MVVKIERERGKVIMSYAAFIGTLLGILLGIISVLSLVFSVKADIATIKDLHELRLINVERKVETLEKNDKEQDKLINSHVGRQ